jgi:hypothetical protein
MAALHNRDRRIRIAPDQSWGSQPALMFAATDAFRAVAGLQIVSLDSLLGEAARQTWTLRDRGNEPVRWPGEGEPTPLLLVRDSVTAASVWHATGFETWATLGSPDGRLLDNVFVIAPDHRLLRRRPAQCAGKSDAQSSDPEMACRGPSSVAGQAVAPVAGRQVGF